MKYGYLKTTTQKKIELTRTTRESKIKVTIEDTPRRDFTINTSIAFFNHMVETIAWRFCKNIDVTYENTQFRLTHVITEDVGIVLGKAFRLLLEQRMPEGINGSGSAVGIIDEAMVQVVVSFEGRCNAFVDLIASPGAQKEQCEDMLSADLIEFFKGFSQGAGATIAIKTLAGNDPHHAWEAIYRGFGEALKNAFKENLWRKGTTAGVKGTLD